MLGRIYQQIAPCGPRPVAKPSVPSSLLASFSLFDVGENPLYASISMGWLGVLARILIAFPQRNLENVAGCDSLAESFGEVVEEDQ